MRMEHLSYVRVHVWEQRYLRLKKEDRRTSWPKTRGIMMVQGTSSNFTGDNRDKVQLEATRCLHEESGTCLDVNVPL